MSTVGIEAMAIRTNLSVASIRYWAELHGDLIGAHRTVEGVWHFSDGAAGFFRQLTHHLGTASDTARKSGVQRAADEAAASVEPETKVRILAKSRISQLADQITALELHVIDLAEETKQMQVLLSRIIELLTPPDSAVERTRLVRAWHPRRVETERD